MLFNSIQGEKGPYCWILRLLPAFCCQRTLQGRSLGPSVRILVRVLIYMLALSLPPLLSLCFLALFYFIFFAYLHFQIFIP